MLYLKRKFLLHRLMDDVKEGAQGGAAAGSGSAAEGAEAGKASAGAAAEAGKSASGDGSGTAGGAAGGEAGAGSWQADWADTYVKTRGGDEKLKGRITRYSDPGALIDAHLNLQEKISKGEFTSKLKADAKPEEVAAWRKQNGIPEAADKYELKLTGDRKVSDADKPLITDMLGRLHKTNASPEIASTVVDLYYDITQENIKKHAESDKKAAAESEHQLRVEWGGNYDAHISDINTFLAGIPAAVRSEFEGGRLASGKPILADAPMMRYLLGVQRQLNPVATVIPGAGANVASAIDDEIKSIEGTMKTDRKAYNKDEKMQARYRELLGAKEKAGLK